MNIFDPEILWNSCEYRAVLSRIWWWVVTWWQELHLLQQVHREEEDLIPCQQLSHAVSLANTIGNNPLVLNIPEIEKHQI